MSNTYYEGNVKMKFDYVIGNPPYQEETDSESTRKPPVYNLFMDEAFKIAGAVELITPARFLFNAGYTPKIWNEKMLNDMHFKIKYYEPISENVFHNTDIKGGVVVSYRDESKDYGSIGIFTKYDELNAILKKVNAKIEASMEEIISSPLSFQLTEKMKIENPKMIDRLRSSAFVNLEEIFFENKPEDNRDYIRMIGLLNGKRVLRYIRRDYIKDSSGTLDSYTLLLPKASGMGEFGELMGPSSISKPGMGYTQTFISVGCFDNEEAVHNTNKYVNSKFCRALLGVLKITQDMPAPKWKYVPLQDFTSSSDIDWSKSIPEIDQQLYRKYGLTEEEIEFIETHVKPME